MQNDGSSRSGDNDGTAGVERSEKEKTADPGKHWDTDGPGFLREPSDQTVVTILVSDEGCADLAAAAAAAPDPSSGFRKTRDCDEDEWMIDVKSPKKDYLPRSASFHEQCRVCQQEKEEDLIELGCQCRGGLAKVHRSCIDAWFRIRGSNKCEICQQVAANVPPPESQPSTNYWVWRVDPAYRGSNIAQQHERGCFSPLWVAFSILIGGLLLDVLISITLGVSALPVNIIIGVIVVLGLGTALRLALEFCHEWSLRRAVQTAEAHVNIGYHPAL